MPTADHTPSDRRRSRRVLRIVATMCIAAAGLVLVVPAPSGAEAPVAVGWWSRQLPFQDPARGEVEGQSVGDVVLFGSTAAQVPSPDDLPNPTEGPVTTVPLPVPPPTLPESPITIPGPDEGTPNPGVPEGGLWVANDLTGPWAVSALRFQGDIGSAILTLQFVPGSTVAGPIVACPIASNWSPGPAGAWRDRPAEDCGRFKLTGRRTTDGTGVEFSIPQGFSEFGERFVDIAIVPAPGAGDVYDLYFEAPGDDALDVSGGQALPPQEEELPPPANLPTTMPPPTVARPSTGAGNAPAVTTAPPVTVAVDDEVAAPATTILAGGTGLPQPVAEVLEPLTESRVSRIIAVTVLLLLGAGLFYVSQQPVRPPMFIGGLAGNNPPEAAVVPVDRSRGIGRFKRDRDKPAGKF